ncbi:MAG: beta-lactamase family protein, partial [Clostridia bacterium]|nr:beta-lactamase family protein [Clostridia bacterium]
MKWLKYAGSTAKVWLPVTIITIAALGIFGYIFLTYTGNVSTLKSNKNNAALKERVDSYLNMLVGQKSFSGSVLIAKKGEIIVNQGYGIANYELGVPNTPKTKFTIASMSKTFTAAAILQLEEAGKLSIQDPLNKYVPNYPQGDKIRIEHLLNCTSGIPDFTDGPDLFEIARVYRSPEQLIGLFKDKPLEFEPGSKFKYSNSGYVLLGAIIEKVADDTLDQYLMEHIFKPLNMKNTEMGDNRRIINNRASGYSVINGEIQNCDFSDSSFHFGDGGICSTAEDLYRWDRALHSGKFLTKQSLDKMFIPSRDIFSCGW